MRRSVRLAGHVLRLTLFVLVLLVTTRYLVDSVGAYGAGPRTFFAVLLVMAAVSLVWRSFLDTRRIARRLRS